MPQIDEFKASIALAFHAARINRRPLLEFPGRLPAGREAAYAIQDAQIALRGDEVAGWKVAMTAAPFVAEFGDERIAGPVFAPRRSSCPAGGTVPWAVFPGGFAAVEAEFVAVMGQDAPAFGRIPAPEEVAPLVGGWHVGMELAGSPLASINELGPRAVVADCGNNDGVVIGPEIPDWRDGAMAELSVRVSVDGEAAGAGSAAKIPGGPLAAVAFLIAHLEWRGRPLKAGQFVSTGALTGIHKVKPGQAAQADFGPGLCINVSIN